MTDQAVWDAVPPSGLRVKRVYAAGRTAAHGLRGLMPDRERERSRSRAQGGDAPAADVSRLPALAAGAPGPAADAPGPAGGEPAVAPVPLADGWQLAFLSAPRSRRVEFLSLMQESADGPPQPERTTRWLTAWQQGDLLAWPAAGAIGRSLRREGREAELLGLYAALPAPADPAALTTIQVTHAVAREVLLLPEPPPAAVSRAASEVEWLLDQAVFSPGDAGWTREAVLHTLALARFREHRFATAELLCQPLLAVDDLPAAYRATALATVALARHALGLPHQPELDEALTLDPEADLVAAAASAGERADSQSAE